MRESTLTRNKTFMTHSVPGTACFNVVHSDDAITPSSPLAGALHHLKRYCIILVHTLNTYAPVSGMPHYPYMGIIWGCSGGFVQQITPQGWGIVTPSAKCSKAIIVFSFWFSCMLLIIVFWKAAPVYTVGICGGICCGESAPGVGNYCLRVVQIPTLAPCTGSGACH